MVMEEIFILTRHGKFQADYLEKIPVYKRRQNLYFLQKELAETERQQEAIRNKHR